MNPQLIITLAILVTTITAFPHKTSPFFNPFLSYNTIRLPEEPDRRIVGGEATDIKYYPHMASLQWFNSHRCGANIISPKFVLTGEIFIKFKILFKNR
jgi:hypothetical protein